MGNMQASLVEVKVALGAGDFTGALEILNHIDLSTLPPLQAVEAMAASAYALHRLGSVNDSIYQYREALSFFASNNLLSRENVTPELLFLAQMLSIGARDVETLKIIFKRRFGKFFKVPRDLRIAPLTNIRTWSEKNNLAISILDPARSVALGGDNFNAMTWRYTIDAAWSVTIPNAEIVAGWDYVIAPTGEVLEGANYMPVSNCFAFMPHFLVDDLMLIAHVWSSQAINLDESAIFLSTPESHHYGHWITDFLPRLRAWRLTEQPLQKIVISANLPAKHRDMLGRFGVRSEDLIECALGARYGFRSLTVVNAGADHNPNPISVDFVRHALAPLSEQKRNLAQGRKLFMVRDIGTRLPANQDELDQILNEFGIESVNPAKWTLDEQEDILTQTSLIIGVFGTELLCLYHLNRGADVIELTLNSAESNVFGPRCAILGFRHHIISCERTNSGQTQRRKVNSDVLVDCLALRKILENISKRID